MRSLKDLLSLEGRVALVTGGAGHIGLACAEALAEMGARIVIADREKAACDARAEDLRTRFGVETLGVAVDLADVENGAKALVAAAVSQFGRLDVLVNNAAFTGKTNIPGWGVPFAEQSVDAWNAAMAVNLTAPFRLAQAAHGALAANGKGSIVNVSSIYGVVGPKWSLYEGTAMANPAGYGASKGGIVQLTRYLSTVMAPKVRVNCMGPGGVARGQPESFQKRYEESTPLGRMAIEEDFKGAFAYLASDASAYVTGQHLLVDGGWTAW